MAHRVPYAGTAVVGSEGLRVLVAGFPVQMTVVIMVTVVLSTHPKVVHQSLQFWQEEQSVHSLWAPALSPPPGGEAENLSLGLTSQRDIGSLAVVLPEHKVHKVLRARQPLEAGPISDMVQQSSQDQAGASGSSCFLSLLQQLGNIYTGLEKRVASALPSGSTSGSILAQAPGRVSHQSQALRIISQTSTGHSPSLYHRLALSQLVSAFTLAFDLLFPELS